MYKASLSCLTNISGRTSFFEGFGKMTSLKDAAEAPHNKMLHWLLIFSFDKIHSPLNCSLAWLIHPEQENQRTKTNSPFSPSPSQSTSYHLLSRQVEALVVGCPDGRRSLVSSFLLFPAFWVTPDILGNVLHRTLNILMLYILGHLGYSGCLRRGNMTGIKEGRFFPSPV